MAGHGQFPSLARPGTLAMSAPCSGKSLEMVYKDHLEEAKESVAFALLSDAGCASWWADHALKLAVYCAVARNGSLANAPPLLRPSPSLYAPKRISCERAHHLAGGNISKSYGTSTAVSIEGAYQMGHMLRTYEKTASAPFDRKRHALVGLPTTTHAPGAVFHRCIRESFSISVSNKHP